MSFDPKVYRNSKDGIGDPADTVATDTTTPWTLVSLTKGVLAKLTTGISVTGAHVDDAAFTVGTDRTQPVAGTYRSVRDSVDDGDAGTLAMTAKRALYVSPESPNGDSLVDETNDRLNVGLVASQNGVDGGAGVLSAKTLRMVHASDDALMGIVTETAPASDTASSGLNGRLQRVAQRITSLIALIPASLGQKAMTASMAVVVASDQTTFPVSPGASAATGGIASTTRLLSAAGTSGDATNVKASAGRLYAIQGYNASTSVRYLKLYNSASAPTAGSGTPVKTLALPPSVGFAFDWPLGYSFSTGIGFTLVTGSADNSSTSVTAADILGLNLDYI